MKLSGKTAWLRASKRTPCPVCGHTDYCTLRADGKSARCMRVESTMPAPKKGGGWFHDLQGNETPPERLRDSAPPPPRIADVPGLALRMFKRPEAEHAREKLADLWRVRASTLRAMLVGIGWTQEGEEFVSFPSQDGAGNIVGVVRRFWTGKKLSYPGTSNAGLFYAAGIVPAGYLWVVEGASDTIVLHDIGFSAIGRPSNTGGVEYLNQWISSQAQRPRVVVIGENDRKPDRPGTKPWCKPDCGGCCWCWPGIDGARRVSEGIAADFWMLPPQGIKDVRDWQAKSGDSFGSELITAAAKYRSN